VIEIRQRDADAHEQLRGHAAANRRG